MVRTLLIWLTGSILCPVAVVLFQNSVTAAEVKPVTVEITTHLGDRQTFVEGDVISFLLSLDRDAYVYLFYEDASANIYQIFPNQKSRKHFYQKGYFMPVPPSPNDFQFKIQAPFGNEKLFVYASDNSEFKLNSRLLGNGLLLIDAPASDLEINIRRQSNAAFGSASMTIVSRSR